MEEKELAAGVSLLNCLGLLLLMCLWSRQVDSQLRKLHWQSSLFLVWDLMVTPGSWLSSMCPSSSQVPRPFEFLTPNFIFVLQFTFISVCVLLYSKIVNVCSVGSRANSCLTHSLSIKVPFEKRHHTSELSFWYFLICLESIYVNITVEEHPNWASSSLCLKDRKILLYIFSPVFTPYFAYACLSPLFSAVSHQASYKDGTIRPFFQFLFWNTEFMHHMQPETEGIGERWVPMSLGH